MPQSNGLISRARANQVKPANDASSSDATINQLYKDFRWEGHQDKDSTQYWKEQMDNGLTGDALRDEFKRQGYSYMANAPDNMTGRGSGDRAYGSSGNLPKGFSGERAQSASANSGGTSGFLSKIYQNTLGRQPDSEGMSYWQDQMDNGMSREDVYNSITQGAEFQSNLRKPGQAESSNYAPEQREVQPNATVQGRMEGLLSEGSRYLDIARQKSAEQANNRGFLNSSMAAGAGERAAIEAALPIASQDAGTFNQRDLTNMQNVNQSRQFNAQADMQTDQFNVGQSNQMRQEQWSQTTQQAHDKTMSELDYQHQRGLIDQKAYANLRGQYLDSITQLARERAISINEIQTNPNIPVEQKSQMIDNLNVMHEMDLQGTSSIFAQMPMWQKNWSEAMGQGGSSEGGVDTSVWNRPDAQSAAPTTGSDGSGSGASSPPANQGGNTPSDPPQNNQGGSEPPADSSSDDQQALSQIDSLYQNLLGRSIGDEGRQYWQQQYRNGLSMADIESSIRNSNEYKVNQLYKNLLGRNLKKSGWDYWKQDFANGMTLADIERSIKQSDEYKRRQGN